METDDQLKILREQIDDIDNKILQLLKERISICKEVGEVKRKMKMSITDQSREKEILEKAGTFKDIYNLIIITCKKIQGDNNEV